MKPHDRAFYDQLDYILQQYRERNIKTIPELMKFVEMAYGDYMEFHPEELPEIRYGRTNNTPSSVSKKGTD